MATDIKARFRFLDGGIVNLYQNNELRCSCYSITNGSKPCLHIILYEKIRDGELQSEGFKWVETSRMDGVRLFVWTPELNPPVQPTDPLSYESLENAYQKAKERSPKFSGGRVLLTPFIYDAIDASPPSWEGSRDQDKSDPPKKSFPMYEQDDILEITNKKLNASLSEMAWWGFDKGVEWVEPFVPPKPKPSLPSSMPDPNKPKRKIRKE